jgi:diguanylate cyclase (GGDEF)-like protein
MAIASFRMRVLLLLISLLLAVQAVTVVTLVVQTNRKAQDQAKQELRSGARVLDALLRLRAEQMQQAVRVLVSDYGFKEAVTLGDRATIASALENSAGRVDARLAVLVDLAGGVVASTSQQIAGRYAHELAAVAKTAGGETPRTVYATLGDTPYLLVGTQLRAPDVIGSVVIGFAVDAQLALKLSGLLGYDVGFFDPESDLPLVASLPETFRRALTAQLRAAGGELAEPTVVQINSESYMAWTARLSESSGSLRIVLHESLADALAPYTHLRTVILVVAMLAMLASVPLANVLARQISRPLVELVGAARRIESGDYSGDVTLQASQEFMAVATTLNSMQRHIAEREQRIRDQAARDELTGLPNRLSAAHYLQSAIATSRENEGSIALLVDVERTRASFGEEVGDSVLREMTRRLTSFAGANDQVSRAAAGQFLIISQDRDEEGARNLAWRLNQSVGSELICNGIPINIEARIGICVYPIHGDQPVELLRRADTALFNAKEQGTALAVYDPGDDDKHRRQLALLGDLRRAIGAAGELSLHYQPKVDMFSRAVRSLEALVRWKHPVHGSIPPSEFVPLAERAGTVALLTNWVIKAAFRQMQQWMEIGFEPDVSINLSAADLADRELEQSILHHTRTFGVRPDRIVFEITESAVMRDTRSVIVAMERLRKHGFRFSVDDFGTGYSSLAQFKHLPVDEIKIDKSFVMELRPDSDDAAIVRATIDLGHNLGVKVVAEGVETPEAWRLLVAMGCDLAQGYLISPPLPADEVVARLVSLNDALVAAETATQQLRVLRVPTKSKPA